MLRPRLYRDPIHTQIRLNRVEVPSSYPGINAPVGDQTGWMVQSLISTRAFQRLRHIRQNGLSNLVFPGMEHSRFTHSVGVYEIAMTMFDAVVRNSGPGSDSPARRLEVATAALLHDVGHGPFSHSMEEVLGALGTPFHHETLTVRILMEDHEVNGILSQVDEEFPARVAAYIDKSRRGEDHWTYRLVSSQLDADRLDYMIRDARMAGIVGHGFDFPRLLDMLHVWNGTRVVVDRHATQAVEAYLLMLTHLYKAVYFHRAIRGATALLTSVLKRAAFLHRGGDGTVFPTHTGGPPNPLRALIELGSGIEVETYVRLGEFHVWQLIEGWQFSQDLILSDLSQRLMRRQRFRAEDVPRNRKLETIVTCSQRVPELISQALGFVTEGEAREYYFVVDEPQRTGYKGYNWLAAADSPSQQDESIWLFSEGINPVAVENEMENSIFQALRRSDINERLMFPHEIAIQMATLMRGSA